MMIRSRRYIRNSAVLECTVAFSRSQHDSLRSIIKIQKQKKLYMGGEKIQIAWTCRAGFRKDKVQNELRLTKRLLKLSKKNSKNSRKGFFPPDNFRIRSKNSQGVARHQHKYAAHPFWSHRKAWQICQSNCQSLFCIHNETVKYSVLMQDKESAFSWLHFWSCLLPGKPIINCSL